MELVELLKSKPLIAFKYISYYSYACGQIGTEETLDKTNIVPIFEPKKCVLMGGEYVVAKRGRLKQCDRGCCRNTDRYVSEVYSGREYV